MKLIKFGAGWCRPCARLQSVLNGMDTPYPIDLVDIEDQPEKAGEYGIRMVPTLLLVDADGVEQKRLLGVRTQTEIQEWIDE